MSEIGENMCVLITERGRNIKGGSKYRLAVDRVCA